MLVLLLAAAAASNLAPAVLGGLEGCWTASGTVRGKDATSFARGEWHLGRLYFVLHLRSISRASPYEAAITYGAGEKAGQIGSFWMDTFGGLYEPSLGLGAVNHDGFALDYHFPDTVYHNSFVREVKGWRWTIMERAAAGGRERIFAEYRLSPATCRNKEFAF